MGVMIQLDMELNPKEVKNYISNSSFHLLPVIDLKSLDGFKACFVICLIRIKEAVLYNKRIRGQTGFVKKTAVLAENIDIFTADIHGSLAGKSLAGIIPLNIDSPPRITHDIEKIRLLS